MRRMIDARWMLLAVLPLLARAQVTPYYQSDFPPEEFKARWVKIFDHIGEKAVALVQGAPTVRGFVMPRQTNEFFYLCGVETPNCYILLDGRTRQVTIYLPPRNERLERAEGRVLSAQDVDLVKQLIGVDNVKSTDELRGNWIGEPGRGFPEAIYAPFQPGEGAGESRGEILMSNVAIASDYWDGRLPREGQLVQLLRTRYPRTEVRDLSPILDELRSVKSSREIAMVKKASILAGLGILEAIKSTKPGLYEYQLDAAARYIFLVNGSRLEGYRSITAAGTPNIWNMHYYRNNSQLKDGDLVLMDYAPDYGYYTSDVGRMFPVNGKFSKVQRELIEVVIAYRNEVLKRIRPGLTTKEIMEDAERAMESYFQKTKFSKPAYEEAARTLVRTGGGVFSHPVGLAVHDDGRYGPGPLKPGHVFTIDPQLRVPDENLYYRCEDVVVVTDNGVENFTEFLPLNPDEIEKLMKEEGVVQKVPPAPQMR